MPKFGFYFQDVLPKWGDAGKKQPGEDVGCELALRRSHEGDPEVFVKSITPGGPAALCGRLAVGDSIAEINGADPLSDDSGSGTSLAKLVEGEIGQPIWLKIKGAGTHVALVRQDPLALSPKPKDGQPGGLGISFKEQAAASGGVEVVISAIKDGGALWLAGLCCEAPVCEGDIITHVDGVPTTGSSSDFTGSPFSRICLSGRRGQDALECHVVRMVTLPAKSLDRVKEYRIAAECIPPAPPSDRVNGNSETQLMAAPLINGLDVKSAAQVGDNFTGRLPGVMDHVPS
jgi:C-terminal processing protease CtpA/Prc